MLRIPVPILINTPLQEEHHRRKMFAEEYEKFVRVNGLIGAMMLQKETVETVLCFAREPTTTHCSEVLMRCAALN